MNRKQRLEAHMSLLRDRIKDAMLSLENDEKAWSDFTVQEVAQVVHDQVASQLQAQIATLQTQADPAMAQSITDLQSQLAATQAELAKHEADTTESDKITALQTQLDDTSGALSDFFDAIKAGNDPAAAIAALQAATGNGADAGATGTDTSASDAASGDAGANTTDAGADTGN